jgi:uncharacterized protein
MLLKGKLSIRAPRKNVWDFLTDPYKIGACAAGVESIEVVEPKKVYRGVVSVGFGNVKARFEGEVRVLELDEPNYAKLKAHGTSSGSAAEAVSEMSFRDGRDGATIVIWTADVRASGQMASLLSGLIVPVYQKFANQFFDEARRRIEAAEKGDAAG